MSDKALKWVLTVIGVITGLGTIGSNVISLGEIKGSIMTMLQAHEKRFEDQAHRLDQHESQLSTTALQIERIKGKIGIVSLNPDVSNTAANTVESTDTEQRTQ